MPDFNLIKIFVEGATDQGFIQFVLEHQFDVQFSSDAAVYDAIIDCKGWTNIGVKLRNLDSPMRIHEGGRNLIIFDADSKRNKGGMKIRKDELLSKIGKTKVPNSIFLFPDNKNDGDLEDVYCSCMKKAYYFFNDCWDGMIGCFEKHQKELILKYPKSSDKVFSYVDLFQEYKQGNYKNSKTKRNYFDQGLWEFDFEHNQYLRSLIDFLKENIN